MFPVPYGHIVLKPEYRKRDSSTSSSSSSSSSSDSDRGSKKCHRKNCSKNKDKKKKKKNKKEKQTTQVSFMPGNMVPVTQVAPQVYVPSQQQQQQQQQQSNQFPGAVFTQQHSIAAFQLGVQYGMNGQNPSPMQGYGMNGSNPAPNVIPISFQIPSTQGPTCPCQGHGSSGVPGGAIPGAIPGGVQYTTTHQWFQQ